MKPERPNLQQLLTWAMMGGCAWFVLAYVGIAALRMRYPYDLEWMEGGTLEHVARLVEGRGLYVEPSLSFVPYLYTPLYYWLCWPIAKVFGIGLPALRAVSFTASLGTFAAIYVLVTEATRDRLAAWVAVGVYASTYAACQSWFDLARVDSVFLCLLAWGLCLFLRSRRHDAWTGLLFTLAFLAKQTALPILAALVVVRIVTERGWDRFRLALAAGIMTALSIALLEAATGGWFYFYAFGIPRSHHFESTQWANYWRGDLAQILPMGCAATLLVLGMRGEWRPRFVRLGVGLGLLGASWLGRLNIGGAENVLQPAFLYLAWMLGEAFARLRDEQRASSLGAAAWLLVFAQLALRFYWPGSLLPSETARVTWAELVARLRAEPGDVLVPHHGHLARLAGKRPSAHAIAIADVYGSLDRKAVAALQGDVLRVLAERPPSAVVLDTPWNMLFDVPWLVDRLQRDYVAKPLQLSRPAEEMGMLSGLPTHPRAIGRPRPPTRHE
jgi:hypothetical protein